MTDSIKNFFTEPLRKTKKPTKDERKKFRKRKVEKEEFNENNWVNSDSSISERLDNFSIVSPNINTDISDEENDITDLSDTFGIDLDLEIKKMNRGRGSIIHTRSNEVFKNEVNEHIENKIKKSNPQKGNTITPEIFYQNDPTPELICEFDKYPEIISGDLSYRSSVLANSILDIPFFRKESFILEEVGPNYIKDFLRQPRGIEFGERMCVNGKSCISCTLSSKTMIGVTKREPEFVIREFLLPSQKNLYIKTGILPSEPLMCILCNRLQTTILYEKASSNNRDDSMEKYSQQYPQTFIFKKSENHSEPPVLSIQNHYVTVCESQNVSNSDAYPIESLLSINPAIGLTMPFKRFDPSNLHITSFQVPIDEQGTICSCYGWEELDSNFQ